jgi:hypothetical protein
MKKMLTPQISASIVVSILDLSLSSWLEASRRLAFAFSIPLPIL